MYAGVFSFSEKRFEHYTFYTPLDSLKPAKKKDPKKFPNYKPKDRRGDKFTNRTSESPMLLENPDNIKTNVELDSSGKFFIVEEKIGDDIDYRDPSSLTFKEFNKLQQRKMIRNYWKNKSSGDGDKKTKDKDAPLSLKIPIKGLEGPFGSNYVDIRPNGMVTLDFAYKHQETLNPQIPKIQQSQGNFDFDNQIQLNVTGKIGEKLKLGINWDTKATFEFQNNFKVEFTGFEEDILQKVEVGNVTMPINSSLISGAQNLFGVKAKMQFGRLTMTTVFASQRGKSEEIKAQGGSSTRNFEVRADNYEANKHFFLGHFFRDNYEKSLKSLPVVNSNTKFYPNRIEVFITNTNNTTVDLRNIIAYTDLGETSNHVNNTNFSQGSPGTAADNKTNSLYDQVNLFRDPSTLETNLNTLNLVKGTDYEMLNNARKLKPEEFTYNSDLGYITLMTELRSYEVLAVAYQYSYNGDEYKVGEIKEDYTSRDSNEVIILKLLKPSIVNTRLTTWDLMMKNIYQLGSTQLQRENFQLRVIYRDDLTGADLPNLQEGKNTKNVPILRMVGLDKLNPQNDPYPDGNFDFVENVTIDPKFGRLIFPVVEPFSTSIVRNFDPATEQILINKYDFFELYDSTKSDASQLSNKNKFFIKGRFQSSSSSQIMLPGAINLAPGSVKVTAGSKQLIEGVDFNVDYNQGKVTIINEGVLASGQEIKVNYEKQDLFNVRQKSFFGTRLDFRVNRDLTIGGTLLHQNERPTLTRVNIGDEPSSNTIWGLDLNYKKDSRVLTRIVDFLPLISTKAMSNVSTQAEFAHFIPGYNSALDANGSGGAAFLDDFEGAETPFDFTRSPNKWKLASTPKRFLESTSKDLDNGYNRALMAWYNVDNTFYNITDATPKAIPKNEDLSHFERFVPITEIFPNFQNPQIVTNQILLDLSYFPRERGPYNYSSSILPDGTFPNPQNHWAGIQREIRNDIDFDNANIQYIEFWVMSPYIKNSATSTHTTNIDGVPFNNANKGKLYINLGNISEDVLPDNNLSFENGLPVSTGVATNNSAWGKTSKQQPLTNAFDNNPGSRERQDLGLDGLNNEEEKTYSSFNGSPVSALSDPSGDDFLYYLDPALQDVAAIQPRYKRFNGIDKNTPENSSSSNYSTPDSEDLNQDNTLNTVEGYYEYEIPIDPAQMIVGQNNIVSRQLSVVENDTVFWYQYRIPIRVPTSTIGDINGFKSIRFMRMYMTEFTDPIVLRLTQLQLVSSQWRLYTGNINQSGFSTTIEPDDAPLVVSTVNKEENGSPGGGNSFGYDLPPGSIRDQDPNSTIQRSQNEQSLRLEVLNLQDKNARAAFKNMNFDLMNYKRLNMWIHAETSDPFTLNGQMSTFIRLGTDIKDNFFEIEVPLYFTKSASGNPSQEELWPIENAIDIAIDDLINVKLERNRSDNGNKLLPFSKVINGKNITVFGNPDLSNVQVVVLGLRNPLVNLLNPSDNDHSAKSAVVWVNELRVTQFELESSWAATARVNAQLADFANVTGSIKYSTVGFGGLDQRISQRERNNTLEYGIASNITIDKIFPEKWGVKLPMYVSHDKKEINPQFNPLDPDVKMDKYTAEEKGTLQKLVADNTTRNSVNFTNVKKVKTNKESKPKIYDIENFSFTFGYNETKRTSYEIKEYKQELYKGGIEYNFTPQAKSWEPFKNAKGLKGKYFKIIKDFNVQFIPSNLTVRMDLNRRLTKTQYYESGPLTDGQRPFYEKSFMMDRVYALTWPFTKSLNANYNANAQAVIDEPNRDPGDQAYTDTIWKNIGNFGRLKNFDQNFNVTYKLPIDKIPIFNWINADAKYTAGFTWVSGALGIRDTLGNLASNKSDFSVNGKLNLETLYNKINFLKDINNPPPAKPVVKNPKDTTEKKPDLKFLKGILRLIMCVRNINVTVGYTEGTTLPGYMLTPTYVGVDRFHFYDVGNQMAFIAGSQDPEIRKTYAERGWLSPSKYLNVPYNQNENLNLAVRATIEPFADFKIQLEAKQTRGSNYQEIFRSNGSGGYESLNPNRSGTFSTSYFTMATSFAATTGADNFNQTFQNFSNNRAVILSRLNNSGYGSKSQDVLIPAFLAAYTGTGPDKIDLSPTPMIPLPNWTISYSGLSKVKWLAKRFPTITINHGYTSLYSLGNYTSSLIYDGNYYSPDWDIFNNPIMPDSFNIDNVLIPLYVVDQVSIRESFSPLIGINVRTKGKVSYKLEYKKSRNLILSMSNGQIREDQNNDFVFGIGFAKSGVNLPKFRGRSVTLKNELNIRLDMTFRETVSYQRKLDEGTTVTAGILNFQIKPSVSYNVTQRLTLQLYFEHTRAYPKLSSSFQRYTTTVGLQVRFTLQ